MRSKPTFLAAVFATWCLAVVHVKADERCKIEPSTPAPQAVSVTVQHTNAVCYGSKTGTATALAVGTAPYTYLWSNGKTTATVNHLAAGTYGVTVTDADGSTDAASVMITQGSVISVYSNCIHTCPGQCTGAADLVVSGGEGPYTFVWSGPGGFTAFTEDVSNLCAGLYWVTITDANGCQKIKGTVVSEVSSPGCEPDETCSLTAVPTNPSCAATCNGSIDITAHGAGPFTYVWENGTTNADRDNLCAGAYSVTATNSNGCTATATYTLTTPALLVSSSVNDATDCNGPCNGSISVFVSGGSAPYMFEWSNGTTASFATSLCPGTYSVTITDANGCSASGPGTVFEVGCGIVDTCDVAVGVTTTGFPCGTIGCIGEADAMVIGGTAPFTYAWSNGDDVQNISGLCVGTYIVTITDANGCTAVGQGMVQCTPDPCSGFSATAMPTADTDCNDGICDGAIALAIEGGTAPYNVNWSTAAVGGELGELCPGAYGFTVTDANGCEYSNEVEVTCETINPCETLAVAEVTTPDQDCGDGICDGMAELIVTGGTAPYSFQWINGGNLAATEGLCQGWNAYSVTDAAGCSVSDSVFIACLVIGDPCSSFFVEVAFTVPDSDCSDSICNGAASLAVFSDDPYEVVWWNTGVSTFSLLDVCVGTYVYSVFNEAGCMITDSVNIPCVVVENPCDSVFINALEISISDANCNDEICDGTVQLADIVGGTAPYSVIWENGTTDLLAQGLCGGFYTYTITDANGCTGGGNAFVNCELVVDTCVGFAVTVQNFADSDCADSICNGAIFSSTTGGVGPFTYTWSNGASTELIDGLCVGEYFLTVTDSLGCTVIVSAEISCVAECSLFVSYSVDHDLFCDDGFCDGNIYTEVIGGVAPFQYQWSNGSTDDSLLYVCAGTYTFTVTDAEGCTYSSEFIAIECVPQTDCEFAIVPVVIDDFDCNDGICDGEIALNIDGVNGPFSYLWSTGGTDVFVTGLCAGEYTLTVTDATGCSIVDTMQVGCFAACPVSPNASITSDSNCSDTLCDGAILANALNGIAPYVFEWSDGSTDATRLNLCPGMYPITITDASGCTASTVFEVGCTAVPPCILAVDAVATADQNCDDGICNGLVELVVTNAIGNVTYAWSNGETTAALLDLCAGLYEVTVTDDENCVVTESVNVACGSVTPCDGFAATWSMTPASACGVTCDGSATLVATGGTAPYSYLWDFGASDAMVMNLCAGLYMYVVTDANGCDVTGAVLVECVATCTTEIALQTTGGLCDGSDLHISVAGDNGSIQFYSDYLWSNGSTEAFIQPTDPGEYCVTVHTVNGNCEGTACVTVEATVLEGFVLTMEESCAGFCNGTAEAVITDGVGPYSYAWDNGSFDAAVLDLCPGVYCVTVTDANQCTLEACGFVGGSDPLEVTVATQNSNNCNDGICSGTATAVVQGGLPPYGYFWSTGEDTESIDSLCSTFVGLSLTVFDAAGCMVETPFSIFCIGIIGIGEESDGSNAALDVQNPASVTVHPNPFNESTAIAFTVSQDQRVTLGIYDVTGRLLTTLYDGEAKAHQTQTAAFNGAAGNGLFVYRLTTSTETLTGNIVQMK